jgi:sugar (pentulose or hexulose) kinase
VGLFRAWEEIERFIRITHVVEPDRQTAQHYAELFAIYRGLYGSLQGHFQALHRVTGDTS